MRSLAALALCLLATPALADAVTYRGDLNSLPIVVEFSEAPESASAGLYARYFYVDSGIDIPMHATSVSTDTITLAVEQPCEDGKCSYGGDIPDSIPQIETTWTLAITDDGAALIGDAGSKFTPVHLERTGTRPYTAEEQTPADLALFASSLLYSGETLTRDTSPYDYLKVNVALQHSDRIRANGVEYDYVTDPRTLFRYPRILYVEGLGTAPGNAFLEQRDWAKRLDALNCRAMMYPGMGWNEYGAWAYGTLGGYEDETVEVTLLTHKVMSWTESGSLFCGGAHPYNHHEFHNLDVQAGTPLDLSRIFSGWVPRNYDGTPVDLETARANPREYQWLPDETLATFVKSHRLTDSELGLDADSECPIDELIDSNLAIGFKSGDVVLFSLDGLPHVITACGSDLYEVPLSEIKDLLTPQAGWYCLALMS